MAYGGTVPDICVRVCLGVRRVATALAGLILLAVVTETPGAAQTVPIKAKIEATVTDGDFAYARLVICGSAPGTHSGDENYEF